MDRVRVLCRVRPETADESRRGVGVVKIAGGMRVDLAGASEFIGEHEGHYTFDAALGVEASQAAVYDAVAKPMVADVLRGFNATLFAYGQTGAGKTHSMFGPRRRVRAVGVVPRLLVDIFRSLSEGDAVSLSCLELYDDLQDLLAPGGAPARPLKIVETKDGTIDVDGCVEAPVADAAAALDLVRGALASRKTACHDMNADSSRSHFVTSLRVTRPSTDASSVVRLVDLAGSERVAKTQATGATLDEAKRINSSLSALGNVISALTPQNASHVPYRDSKLTRLLHVSAARKILEAARAERAEALAAREAADRVAHAAKLEAAKAEDAPRARFELGRDGAAPGLRGRGGGAPRRRRARGLRAEPRLLRREPRGHGAAVAARCGSDGRDGADRLLRDRDAAHGAALARLRDLLEKERDLEVAEALRRGAADGDRRVAAKDAELREAFDAEAAARRRDADLALATLRRDAASPSTTPAPPPRRARGRRRALEDLAAAAAARAARSRPGRRARRGAESLSAARAEAVAAGARGRGARGESASSLSASLAARDAAHGAALAELRGDHEATACRLECEDGARRAAAAAGADAAAAREAARLEHEAARLGAARPRGVARRRPRDAALREAHAAELAAREAALQEGHAPPRPSCGPRTRRRWKRSESLSGRRRASDSRGVVAALERRTAELEGDHAAALAARERALAAARDADLAAPRAARSARAAVAASRARDADADAVTARHVREAGSGARPTRRPPRVGARSAASGRRGAAPPRTARPTTSSGPRSRRASPRRRRGGDGRRRWPRACEGAARAADRDGALRAARAAADAARADARAAAESSAPRRRGGARAATARDADLDDLRSETEGHHRRNTREIVTSKLGVAETAYAMDVLTMQYKQLDRELAQTKADLAAAVEDLAKERDKPKASGGLFASLRAPRPLAKPVR
ncbi:hypothetical protein JL720_6639 [Aureococcus anophagefferens]|nr:hypothetical protein JL720_6639 [Aureococcus anophagefferens]